jgi:hypothetical protein
MCPHKLTVQKCAGTFNRAIGSESNSPPSHHIRLELMHLPPAIRKDKGTNTMSATIPKFAGIDHSIWKPKNPGTGD